MILQVQLAGAVATLLLAEIAARIWIGYLAGLEFYSRGAADGHCRSGLPRLSRSGAGRRA